MDKVKTIAVREAEMVQFDNNNIKLTDEYVELVPEGELLSALRIDIIFGGVNHGYIPFLEINDEMCPIIPQLTTPFEIKSSDDIVIQSLKINKDFRDGLITMFIYNKSYNKK
ncbi:hypothetical protein [Clostridium beijerinckii]|uniref:Uncharacterized protein n=1 Tax=Clostridium beijerinckii TaxID=1520 RepID=A0A1S9N9B8_CLOBE|nr:hypothetical protein [Clostridium beijerinckii]OOP74144.1 hypothetical protein CBEIBR21_06500 [Clostridium beijerinckii]